MYATFSLPHDDSIKIVAIEKGVLVLLAAVCQVRAQLLYCKVASSGPCVSGLCPQPTDQCINTQSGEVCCDKNQIGTRTPSTTPSTVVDCQDLLHPRTGQSDCPQMKSYCNDPIYYKLMTQQCPKTCGRCQEASSTPSGCQDLVNPVTGKSDCQKLIMYCNHHMYVELMKQQCPKTCRYCV